MPAHNALTRRQRIKELLRDRPSARPTSIRDALDDVGIKMAPEQVIEEITEIRKSLDDTETLYVAPAECRECGFDEWDNLVNIPSRCPDPDCRSEWIAEPEFTIK